MQILIAAFLLFCFGCEKKQSSHLAPSYPVHITEAKAQDTPIFVEALGHVQSITSINLYSRIEGELIGIHFNQGSEVKKGDLLFSIDPKPYLAKLKTAEGNLERTRANLILAQEKVKRYKSLTKDEYYSQIDYETLQANLAATYAELRANEGEVDQAKINLDYCSIFAPIDGKTGILNIDFGNLVCVSCQTPLVTLNQMSPIFVTFSIPEVELPKIQRQKEKTLDVLAAYEDFSEDQTFKGLLYMLDNRVDPGTGMVKLRAIFENTDRALFPGQFIRTRVILKTIKDAVVIPFSAIQITQEKPIVFVLNQDSTVEQRVVTLGQRQNGSIVVTDGIKPGEKIVTEGQMNLESGTKVFISGGKNTL